MQNCDILSVGAASGYIPTVQTYLISTSVQWYHEKSQLNSEIAVYPAEHLTTH